MDRKLVEGIIRVSIITFSLTFQPTILLRVTPSANRNSYRVAADCGPSTMGFHLLISKRDEINTKSRGHCWRLRLGGAVSNAYRKTSFPPGHRHHHHRHALHDASSNNGKKTAVGGKKSPAGAGTKTAACRSPTPVLLMPLPCYPKAPPLPSPRGGSPFSLCLRWLGGTPSLWGGAGRGFWEGWGGAPLPWQLCRSCDFIAQG